MVTLSQQLKLLADGFRKRYGKTETLTLADMTKLVTPPPFANGTVIAKNIKAVQTDEVDFNLLAIPPKMSVPITLMVKLGPDSWIGNFTLCFNNDEIRLNYPGMIATESGIGDYSDHAVVKLPANSVITSTKASLKVIEDYNFGGTIESITATYVGGVINRLLSAFTSLIGGEAA